MSRGRLGFLDHEGAAWFDLSWSAEMFDIIEGTGWQSVDSDAVLGRIDHCSKRGDQSHFVGVATDYFEDGLLYAVSVCFADLRDFAQSALSFWGDGFDVVGDQEVHLS